MKKLQGRTLLYVVIPIMAIICVAMPLYINNYYLTVLNSALVYLIAVFGLSILMGLGGMMSFTTVSFMGVGAYATAYISMHTQCPTILSVVLAVIICGIVALLIGLLVLRLKGPYFTFATIGFVQVAYAFFLNYKPMTGGPTGLPGIPKLNIGAFTVDSLLKWFYVLLGVAILCSMIVSGIRRSALGRALEAARDNEVLAQSIGINIYFTRIVAFIIASSFAGLAGALLAHMNAYLSAYLFTFDISVNFLIMIMLGGVNSTVGAVLGTILITLLPEVFRFLQSYMKLIFGIIIILLMIFMPDGLAGIISDALYRVKKLKRSIKEKKV